MPNEIEPEPNLQNLLGYPQISEFEWIKPILRGLL